MNGVDVGLVFFNQKGYKVNKKTTEINSPPPAQAFVFLDEHQNSIDDGHFGFAPESDIWMNLPAMWHNNGCDFSFADGHVEAFKWPDARTLAIKVIKFSAHTQQSGLEAAAVSGGDQELIFPTGLWV